MGIVLKELLSQEFFRDFEVVAGRKGLNKKIQGVAVMDAPDAMKWSKGRELILTSGYAISKDPDSIRRAFEEGDLSVCAALMIKKKRYLGQIPQDIIDVCEEHDFPLISMPYEVAYMDVMNQVNIAVLNRTIRRFRIPFSNNNQYSSLTYKDQKINKILKAVETEMDFPGFIYDLTEQKDYYSSPNFKQMTEKFGLKESEYWNPSKECSKYTLCDFIHMVRYRLIDFENPGGPRVSWILIPILIGDKTKAYFVVMESKEFLDYYDEYSIRIAYLMLQAVYEQIAVAENISNIGFENFVLFAMHNDEKDSQRLAYQAYQHGLSVNDAFICVRFHQTNEQRTANAEREEFMEIYRSCYLSKIGKFAFVDENDGVILIVNEEGKQISKELLWKYLEEFAQKIEKHFEGFHLNFGISMENRSLTELKAAIQKCQKALTIGEKIHPDSRFQEYEALGPLAWLDIPEAEFSKMISQYREMMQDEKQKILLETLKVYMENNMNYSLTAEKLFVHINTVRKRIDKINQIIQIDWNDYISRLKLQLLLQLLEY